MSLRSRILFRSSKGFADDCRRRLPAAELPGWLGPANRLVRGLIPAAAVSLGTIHVLTVPGRRTGKPRPTPVSPLILDGRRYVIAGLPQGDWARNVRAAGRGDLARGRRHTAVDLTEVHDGREKDAVLRAFPRLATARGAVLRPAGPGQRGRYRSSSPAVADRVAVFRVTDRRPG